VKVGRRATIKEREVRFEEEVLHHLSSRAAFVGAPLLTVGIEIPQKQNRRRKLTNKVLALSDIACCRGEKIYGTYGYSFMASSPKCNGLQASIDVQLLVRGCVFVKHIHTTMQRAISFHRMYTIVCIFF